MTSMFNYLISTVVTIGYSTLILYLLSLLAVVSAVFVIVSKNPVVSVLFLIGLFFFIAFFLILIDVDFIGISYILVYVGAVSILFLFILMLINIRVSELLSNSENSILLLSLVGLFFLGTVSPIIPNEFSKLLEIFNNITYYVSHNYWEINVYAMSNISSLGNIMYTSYSILLLIASLILLLAMVGAIVITIKPKNLYAKVNSYKV
uniref:NADH-ubiquinone oxidoreductase chain 6 n=1 Tax=Graphis scripta TaxID=71600 RepID=A0A4P8DP85_9LECA|nr:NADH dehydrogenase subunit 6 [Graphis scripta]